MIKTPIIFKLNLLNLHFNNFFLRLYFLSLECLVINDNILLNFLLQYFLVIFHLLTIVFVILYEMNPNKRSLCILIKDSFFYLKIFYPYLYSILHMLDFLLQIFSRKQFKHLINLKFTLSCYYDQRILAYFNCFQKLEF